MKNFDFLEGFEKRMQLVAAVDSIINRKNKTKAIEDKFETGEIENIIFSVLVYIMDKTLSEDEDCTINNISSFLSHILKYYKKSGLDSFELANYIIKDILQNNGEKRTFHIMNYSKSMIEFPVRLISDKIYETEQGYKIKYYLTDAGYDFLFRTKEVDDEISFSVEEFKLRELIKRKNYKKALEQSKNLIQMVRQKKNDVLTFIQKIKENIYSVNVADYEKIIKSTYELLQQEYEVMNEIKIMIDKAQNKLDTEIENLSEDENIKKAKSEIFQIKRNIETTINEQQSLIINRHNLSKIYIETIGDSFEHTLQKRFDIETSILSVLEKMPESRISELWKLFNPLFKPDVKKYLNILKLYEKQGKLQQEREEKDYSLLIHDEFDTDYEKIIIKERNLIYKEIVKELLNFGIINQKFRFGDFLEYLQKNVDDFNLFLKEHRIFKTMLKLYEIGEVNIKLWQSEKENIIHNISGEFDISYCLFMVEEEKKDLFNIEKIIIEKTDDKLIEYKYEMIEQEIKVNKTVTVNDYLIEVITAILNEI
ncbi:MAG: hypothetical protein WC337_04095 [Candidatus Muiribacteriota bacterium]